MRRFRCYCFVCLSLLVLGASIGWSHNDLETAAAVQRHYDRAGSRVMVRVISSTERATLDHLAYDRNCLFHYPALEGLQAPASAPALAALTFGEALEANTVVDRMEHLPLTDEERSRPLAWQPLLKLLTEWDYDIAEPLLTASSQVSGEKWGNDDLVRPLQQISTAYLHGSELWVKVEFRPELTWLPADDEDGDGYRESYGRMPAAAWPARAMEFVRGDYLSQPLTREQVQDHFFALTSEWYQALQTVPLKPEESRPWPNADTDAEITRALEGQGFAEPFVVIRGKPYGEIMYSVFIFPEGSAVNGDLIPGLTDWAGELERHGGSWESWTGLLGDFQADVRSQLQARPAELKGLRGQDNWLFFRGDLDYLLSGDLRQQADKRDPYPAIMDFNQQLRDRGMDLLLVVIPTKAEVYPEKLSASAPAGGQPYVGPYCRKLLGELASDGVAVVDLLPAFLAAREGDEPLYMPQDTHWTNRGLRLAAQVLASAVGQRPVGAVLPLGTVQYQTREVTCTRLGDICAMLTDQERIGYRPMKLSAQQVVRPDGTLYEDDPESPLVMLGDSFTGVFHLEDCKHAGLSAHLARELGMPVDLIMAQGSGPRIRGQLARRGAEAIAQKKLVIWTVVSRDLYNYWAPWDLIRLP